MKRYAMVSAIDSALSGIAAASKRIQVSANNLANQNSTQTNNNGQITDQPYTPQRVDQISLSNGGVQAIVKDVNPATVDVPDLQTGQLTKSPNVDTANELIQMQLASYDFKANLKTIKVQDELFKNLLDIQS